jgi:hypothetical protein
MACPALKAAEETCKVFGAVEGQLESATVDIQH